MPAGLTDERLPGEVLLVLAGPCDVVHSAGTRYPGASGRRVIDPAEVALLAVEAVGAVAEVGEPELLGQQALVGADDARRGVGPRGLDPEDRMLGWDVRVLGPERRVAVIGDDEHEREAVIVVEPQPALLAHRLEPAGTQALLPERERVLGADAELDPVDHSRTGVAARRAGELEPGEDRPGRPALVAEVEVVGVRLVEVDRLLHEPQPEHVGVERDVLGGVGGDHRDVVETLKTHIHSRRSDRRSQNAKQAPANGSSGCVRRGVGRWRCAQAETPPLGTT